MLAHLEATSFRHLAFAKSKTFQAKLCPNMVQNRSFIVQNRRTKAKNSVKKKEITANNEVISF